MKGVARRAVPVTVTLMLSAMALMAPAEPILAQTPSALAPVPQVAQPAVTNQARLVEGTIEKVTGDRVTLANGTELTIPGSVNGQRADLKPGESVKASYEEKGGQKIVTFLLVEPTHPSGTPDGVSGCC